VIVPQPRLENMMASRIPKAPTGETATPRAPTTRRTLTVTAVKLINNQTRDAVSTLRPTNGWSNQ
jgi:hypothetical protein